MTRNPKNPQTLRASSNQAQKSRAENSKGVLIGVEEEFIAINTAVKGALKIGEVIPDVRKYISDPKQLSKRNKGATSGEVTLSVIETQTKPLQPHRLAHHMDQISAKGHRNLKKLNIALSPMPSVALKPKRADDIQRGFTISDDAHYKPYITAAAGPDNDKKRDILGLCGMHVHVSMHGRLEDTEILTIASRLRSFLPYIVAITGSSAVYSDGRLEADASSRWSHWTELYTSYDLDFGPTVDDYRKQVRSAAGTSGMKGNDPEAWRRVFAAVRPNFELGTVEVRVSDVLRSVTERQVIPLLIAGLVQAVSENEKVRMHEGGIRNTLARAAGSGMHPPADVLMYNPDPENEDLYNAEPDAIQEWVLRFAETSLKDQGTWQTVVKGLDLIKQYGTGADRQMLDVFAIHEAFKANDVPNSDYEFREFVKYGHPLSEAEARALHVVTAIGATYELKDNVARNKKVDEVIQNLVNLESGLKVPSPFNELDMDLSLDIA